MPAPTPAHGAGGAYTPMFRDHASRLSGVLLQPAQAAFSMGASAGAPAGAAGRRSMNLSFAQRRRLLRQSEGGPGAATGRLSLGGPEAGVGTLALPSPAPAVARPSLGTSSSSSSSAGASSVAQRILEALGDVAGPVEQARLRPVALALPPPLPRPSLGPADRQLAGPAQQTPAPVPAAGARAGAGAIHPPATPADEFRFGAATRWAAAGLGLGETPLPEPEPHDGDAGGATKPVYTFSAASTVRTGPVVCLEVPWSLTLRPPKSPVT